MDQGSVVSKFTVKGEPVSKARPRIGKGGAYTPAKSVAAEQAMGWAFRAATKGHVDDGSTTYGVRVEFHCATNQRRDVDNMLKTVLDGLNGIAFKDDSQVVEVACRKFLPPTDTPRTEVMVYRVGDWPITTNVCSRCGDEFEVFESWSTTKKYCSPGCRNGHMIERQGRTCVQCGVAFMDSHNRSDEPRQFCSMACKYESGRVRLNCDECKVEYSQRKSLKRAKNHCSQECRAKAASRGTTAPRGRCESCGGTVSKKEYRRCRACIVRDGQPQGNPMTDL